MTLEQLIRFSKVAQTLSFTTASEEMYIGLSTISKSVSDLEKELGVNLLLRTKQGVLLTAAGRLMADETDYILKQIQSMRKKVIDCARQGEGGSLIIAVHPLVSENLTKLFGDFMMHYPNDNFLLLQKPYGDIGEAVRSGDADVGVTFSKELDYEDGDFDRMVVDQCRMCVAVSPEHPLSGRAEVTLAELERENLTVTLEHGTATKERPEIENMFRNFPIKKTVGSQETMIAAVRANQAVGLAPSLILKAVASDLSRLNISDFQENMDLCIFWERSSDKTALRQFLSIAKEKYCIG